MKPLILVILALSIGLFSLQLFQSDLVFYRDLIKRGEWWRLLSGNFVHSNYPHLFLNVAGLWILGLLFIDHFKVKTFIFSIIFLGVFVGVGLYYFDLNLQKYYGFSGILYGLFIVGGACAVIQKDYFNGISIIVLIIGKLIWDLIHGGSTSSEAFIGVPVSVHSHLYGIIAAGFVSIVLIIQYLFFTPNKGSFE